MKIYSHEAVQKSMARLGTDARLRGMEELAVAYSISIMKLSALRIIPIVKEVQAMHAEKARLEALRKWSAPWL